MYAIIATGGKQYRVKKGDVIDIELLNRQKDGKIKFSDIVFFHDGKTGFVGLPTLEKFSVTGEILGEIKGPKVIAYKYKKRKNYRRKVGHRQKYQRVKITEIAAS